MGKHFISVLGTGCYQPCKYEINKKEWETAYIQEAILQIVIGELGVEDKITIFLTEEARESNWEDRNYKEFELEKNKNLDSQDIREGLRNILVRTYGKDKVKAVEIPVGKTEEELDEIFEIIYNEIEEGEEVYFDITHGLRNIPMQALTILNYARVLKKITIAGIYYGAYEVMNEETGITPIFNLSRYNEILEWTSAAEAFVNAGDGKQIKKVYDRKNKDLDKRKKIIQCEKLSEECKTTSVEKSEIEEKLLQEQKDMQKIANVINGIVNLTTCLETGRGKNFSRQNGNNRKSIYGAYLGLKVALQKINEEQKGMIRPLKPLFDEIEKSIAIFENDGTNASTGMAAIQWAISYQLTQQGYTALEETMKTVICEFYGLQGDEMREREWIVSSAMKTLSNKVIENKEEKDEGVNLDREAIITYWEKNYKDKRLNEQEIEIAKKIIREIPKEYAELVYNVSDNRNNINHFGFKHDPFKCTDLENKLSEYFLRFQELYNKIKIQKNNK